MKAIMNRVLSGLLALAVVLSLCAMGIAPHAHAAATDPKGPNVALGKSVAFACGAQVTTDANYGADAVKAGLSVLTDGISDSPNWWVNNGNPYVALKSSVLSGPYIFSVDLGASYSAEQVSVYSYGRPGWSVYPVEEVTYTISTNGTDWQTLGSVKLADAIKNTIDDPRYPGETVDIYEFALPVDAIGRYVRATFNTNASGLVGIGEFEVYGSKAPELITSGASITYFGHGSEVGSDANWGSAAVEAGLSVLTDGVGNSPNWWVNNGNPNIGLKNSVLPGEYVFNLNIGSQSTVSRISTYFYSRTAWGVDAPDAVTYSVSADGIKWTQVGTVDKASATQTELVDTRNPDDQAPTIYTFTLRFDAVDAQYVKVTFGSNAVGLIGLQEIQAYGVKKTITNLALGRLANSNYYTYEVTGGGTGYEASGTTKPNGTRYTVTEVENASVSRLTDGTVINASAVTYPSSWGSQKWNSSGTIMSKYLQIYRNDSRIITMDLGALRNVTGIRMHFGALEAQGFYMPTNVTYYLSADGENYYEVADVWNYQAASDSNDKNISGSGPRHVWYSASGINFNARYVKVIFPVNVYIITDELQVYGSEVLSSNPTALESCEKYDPLEKYVGHFANQAQTGGVRNEFMAYSGWYINSDGSEVYNTYKTAKEYMTSIAYIDSNGVPQDWLFDDVTVMGHYYTSRGTFNSYKAGYTSGKYYANQSDWYEWLCYAFGKSASGADLSYDGESVINLEALEEAARSAKETLNDPDYKVGVKLVLFPAVEYQENWGTINGKKIDFTVSGAGSQEAALANRKAAYQWYVDQAVAMWEAAGFEHLELTGFYYYEETIHESTDRIAKAATQELTKIVHEHATPSTNTKPAFDSTVGGHLYIYQLPFYQSEGYWNWAEYGFDYALMQPNYSFYDMYTLTQLKECAELCTYYGLGMQMEFGGTASQAYINKFQDYLNYGVEYGYQSAVVSWYMSTWGCYSMAYNNNGTRFLYDMVYKFVKGQTIPACQHPEHNLDGRCTVCAENVGHNFVSGKCVCGAVYEADYYLIGYINGANYGCEEDAQNLGEYKFVNGELVATFNSDSYVFVKTSDNVNWYMTDGWLGTDVTTATLYNTAITGENSDKLYVPGGVEITFTLEENAEGTLTLSYVAAVPECEHSYTSEVTTAAGCETEGVKTYTCSKCGDSYTESIPATGHNYVGGSCSACGAADPDFVLPAVTMKYPTVSFEDEIIMNVFFAVENLGNIGLDKIGLLTFSSEVADGTVENADAVIPGVVLDAATGFYCANTNGIAAKNLGDEIYFLVYVELPDGTYVYSKMVSYSPMKYAYSVLNGNYGTEMKALVAAMLDYGAAAQVYFNHNTDALVNAAMTDAHKALVKAYSTDMVNPVVNADSGKLGAFAATSTGFSRRYPTVSFESAFSINYFFTPSNKVDGDLVLYYWNQAAYNNATILTTANATGRLVMTGESEMQADVAGIAAKDLDGTIYVAAVYQSNGTTYCSGVLAYSIGAYCLDRIANGSATMQSFAAATAVYGYYAKAYFAK